MMTKKATELIRNLGLFSIANFLPSAVSFLMIPIYTRYLSTEVYGRIDLFFNTIQLLMPVFTLQIQDAIMRYTLDSGSEKEEVFQAGIRITAGGFLLLSVLCMLLWGSGLTDFGLRNVLLLLFCYLAATLNNIISFFCRGIDEVTGITLGSLLNTFVSLLCNLLFLVYFKWGFYGFLAAYLIGITASTTLMFCKARLWRFWKWRRKNRETEREMVRFSAPLILNSLSWWVNNASDKYVLTFFCGVSTVGMYAAAYKIPTILKVFGDVIAMAFSISAIKEFDWQDEDGFIGKSYSMISLFMTVCCSGLMLCNVWVAKILFAGEFFSAWRYVPPLLVSVLMNQLSCSCENIFVGARKTKIISVTAVLGAVINTALNFVLIPVFGPYGASVATAVGFTCFWAFRYYKLKQYVAIKNNLKKECVSYLLLVVQVFLAYWGNRFWYLQLLVLGAILLLYAKELLAMGKKYRKFLRR